jgi:hypothetical protein
LRAAHLLVAAFVSTAAATARGDETNSVTGTDFPSFRIIAERNIFNVNRTQSSRSRGEPERRVVVQSLALVGTMSYEKGTYAVFDGTESEYRKVLKVADTVAGHQIDLITSGRVVLTEGDRRVELKVGQQLSREEQGPWEVKERSSGSFARGGRERREGSATDSGAEGASAPAESSGGGSEDEVLKRLLEKRAKETNP